jgi:putative hemin transport protein
MHNTDSLLPGKVRPPLTAAQRLAAGIPHRVTPLKGPFSALLHRIHQIGSVTILSGNDSAIQEKTGVYEHPEHPEHPLNEDADNVDHTAHQPLLHQKWKYGFAVSDEDDEGNIQRGLQFFDGEGDGLYKIMLHASSNVDAYHAIVSDFAAAEQTPVLDIFRTRPLSANEGIAHIDIDALRADWARVNNAEDFLAGQTEFDHLRLHKLRLAGKAFAHQVANDSVRILLQKMADLGGTVMTLIGNAGIVQAYQGRVKQIRRSDVWLNILGLDYRLRLREDHIDSVWVAKKPTTNGVITSLELFNRQGISIARFFSIPEPGRPEPREWRDSIMRLLPVFGA